jgi:hypothetical protein
MWWGIFFLYSEILGENLGSKKAVGDDGQPRTYQSLGHVARYYATLNLKVHVFTRGRRTSYICAASSTFLLSPLRFAAKILSGKTPRLCPQFYFTWAAFTCHAYPKYFFFHPSHRIFRRMHETLNVGKKIINCIVCVKFETNLLSLINPWWDKFYQITTKSATVTFHQNFLN